MDSQPRSEAAKEKGALDSALFAPLIAEALQRQKEASDSQFKNFEQRIVMLFSQENWLISELVSKYCNLTSLIDQVSDMIKELQTLDEPEKELEQEELGFRELTAERLVEVLSGKQAEFSGYLQLKEPLQTPLYRDRNFRLAVELRGQGGELRDEPMQLEVSLFGVEYPPHQIQLNNEGKPIFKGVTSRELRGGAANFDRLQIRQVTSHFRKGEVFLVVSQKEGREKAARVRPLVIQGLVVKAKKLKDCRQN